MKNIIRSVVVFTIQTLAALVRFALIVTIVLVAVFTAIILLTAVGAPEGFWGFIPVAILAVVFIVAGIVSEI